jgi:protein transport protein DSL1/ZW10
VPSYQVGAHGLTGYQEASIADITYLFDQGALVDFEVDELIKLVKGLFADTPLRANTISRIQSGHPLSR